MSRVLVTGAAGFIGHHLCRYLKERGYWVRGVDYQEPKHEVVADEIDWHCDLRYLADTARAFRGGIDEVYHLAADMGGMGYIGTQHLNILIHNTQINVCMARMAEDMTQRLLFASSACVYPERMQTAVWANALTERDAWAGKPDTAYGIEKLYAEEIFRRLGIETEMEVRIARFHNIYGPECTWEGGREKAPAALCRKVAEARKTVGARLEIWRDGKQTRSFCHISDCLEMLHRLMHSNYNRSMNIGTGDAVSINDLADVIMAVAGVRLEKRHIPGPQGVRGRNADLSTMRQVLGYQPQVSLEDGMEELYQWVESQVEP